MSINEKKDRTDFDDFFSEDFEVIYEGELPEPTTGALADDYKDVLSQLSQLDDETTVDYVEENRTGYISPELVAARQEAEQREKAQEDRNENGQGKTDSAAPAADAAGLGSRILRRIRNLLSQ